MILLNGHTITPTIFPDGTSQVWKLPLPENPYYLGKATITWHFENEREVIDVLSLRKLLHPSAITGLMVLNPLVFNGLSNGAKLLIVDDICDRGTTFIEISKYLRKIQSNLHISLMITHGLFSGGKNLLLQNGIDEILTTNSLLRNSNEYKV